MASVWIYQDTKGKDRCRSCQAPIEWAENVTTGRKIPFDGEIVAVKINRHEDGRMCELVDLEVTASHFSTCPKLERQAPMTTVEIKTQRDLAHRLGEMAWLLNRRQPGRAFTQARLDEIVLLLREAEKRLLSGLEVW